MCPGIPPLVNNMSANMLESNPYSGSVGFAVWEGVQGTLCAGLGAARAEAPEPRSP